MKFNKKKYFEIAKEKGLEASDISLVKNHSLSVSIYHGAVDSLNQNETMVLNARGILNGKFGSVTTEIVDKNTPEYLVDKIIKTASTIESDNPSIIFKGSEKYHKKNLYKKDLLGKPVQEKIDLLLEIEKRLYAFDERINDVVEVGYSEGGEEFELSNSYGLNLKQKSCNFYITAYVNAKKDEEVRPGGDFFVGDNFDDFKIDEFVKKVARDALDKLGSTQCKSKKYPVVLNNHSVAALANCYLSSMDAEEIQKLSSLFVGKLNQPVASKKFTVIENPLLPNVNFRYFDDEGVATTNKFLIKNGVLQTYLYTLETAMKDGVEPTGNGYRGAGKAKASFVNAIIKPGKKSETQLFESIKEGVYITELKGMHAGMNEKSGNFSLQAEGFMIREGKKAEPLALITVAGNLVDLFMNVKEIGNNSELDLRSGITSPSIRFGKLAISGK